jgi:cysteine desulfurase/selenocysteine lyase
MSTIPFDPVAMAPQFPIFAAQSGGTPLCYLDSAATAQVPNVVIQAMADHDSHCRANVKRGIHRLAEAATEAYEAARSTVATFLGSDDSREVVFTSGTTAGINLLALSLGQILKPGDEILISQAEHHSNLVPWQMLCQRQGTHLRYLPVREDGTLEMAHLDALITAKTRLVALTHASNVTGAITDVATVCQLAHGQGAHVMLDGAQMAPHGPLDLPGLGVDFYLFSGHKAYGPSGIGVLWGRRELLEALPPAFGGGEMILHVTLADSRYAPPPQRFEAGTPPITQAVGLAAALNWLSQLDIGGLNRYLEQLTKVLIQGLIRIHSRHPVRILGPRQGSKRLPLLSFVIEGVHPHDICQVMSDRHNVALRGGHHCAEPLHHRLGLDGSVRASLAAYNSRQDVDTLLNGLEECLRLIG